MKYLNSVYSLVIVVFGCLILGSCQEHASGKYLKSETFDNSKQPPVVNFLNKEEAKFAILDESFEPYYSILELREIEVLVGEKSPTNRLHEARNFTRSKFSKGMQDFTYDEKTCITYVINVINSILNENGYKVFTNQPWNLIKSENWLCGGSAYTRGEYIILSQRYLDKYINDWGPSIAKDDLNKLVIGLGGLLVHEKIHSIQRNHPEIFEVLYCSEWGFKKVDVVSKSEVRLNQLTNPDAPKSEWAFLFEDNFYWIKTVINPKVEQPTMGKDFMEIAFCIEQNYDKWNIKQDSLGRLIKFDLRNFESYIKSYPVERGLDHPNEISAYMFSQYFVSLYQEHEPFENCSSESLVNSNKFVNWMKKYLI